MDIVEPIIEEFRGEAAITRKLLERVPEKDFDWKPHPKSMSLCDLVSHITDSFTWLRSIVEQDEIVLDPDAFKPWTAASKQDLLDTFERNVAQGAALLKGVPDERMLARWKMTAGGKDLLSMPRVAVVRAFTLNHHIHHRGQLSVYLRLKDVPLPQIYGPSADEPDMAPPD